MVVFLNVLNANYKGRPTEHTISYHMVIISIEASKLQKLLFLFVQVKFCNIVHIKALQSYYVTYKLILLSINLWNNYIYFTFVLFRDSNILGSTSCSALATIRHIIAYAELMNLGFIALFRCLGLIKPQLVGKMTSSRSKIKIRIIIVGIWLFVILLHLPAACFGVSPKF